jgi:hypothetical protein
VLLAVKLLLAPAFVLGTSLLARRYGSLVGGMVGGLPVVGGPVLLVLTLDHGERFGAGSARGTLVGLLALATFVLVYARTCARFPPLVSMVLGWVGFFAVDVALADVELAAGVALAAAWAWFAVATRWLPPTPTAGPRREVHAAWDLPVRAMAAAGMVLLVSALSDELGPRWSGLLAPFPIIGTVLAVFTHAQLGVADAVLVMRGLMAGYYAYALFAFVVAVSLVSLGTAGAFAAAVGAALGLQFVVARIARADPR